MNYLLLGSIIIFLASFIQVVTGFGFALIAVPLLAYFLPLQNIVPLVVFFSLITNLWIMRETYGWVRMKQIRFIILFGIMGIPFGVYALKVLNGNLLKVLIGLVMMITAAAMIKGFKIKFKREIISSGVAGFLSGFLNGSISMSGPPVVLFLTNQGNEKDVFRANLSAYGIILNIFTIGTFIVSGGVKNEIITNFIYFFPGLLVGGLLGSIVARKINEALFRKMVLVFIMAMGVTAVITALGKI